MLGLSVQRDAIAARFFNTNQGAVSSRAIAGPDRHPIAASLRPDGTEAGSVTTTIRAVSAVGNTNRRRIQG
jgi:hypothetical protein